MSNYETDTEDSTGKRAKWESFAFSVCADKEHVYVANHSHGDENVAEHTYEVEVWNDPVSCTCPDHKHRHRRCKHMRAVAANEPVMQAMTAQPVETDGGQDMPPEEDDFRHGKPDESDEEEDEAVTDGGVVEDQSSLWTYGEEVAERSEDWLPRTEECDCDRIHCFHNVDWNQLNARVEALK